jgi:hypothetical protein
MMLFLILVLLLDVEYLNIYSVTPEMSDPRR